MLSRARLGPPQLTLKAMVRVASARLIRHCLSFASCVAASRYSSSESPTCRWATPYAHVHVDMAPRGCCKSKGESRSYSPLGRAPWPAPLFGGPWLHALLQQRAPARAAKEAVGWHTQLCVGLHAGRP